MAKSDRVMRLLTLLRQLPQPVTANRLAKEAEVSQRTVYRDIDTLRASGVMIDGAPRYGYTMTEDPAMPPLMFTRMEVEAIMLALGVAEYFLPMDPALSDALSKARTKIVASMPERVQRQAQHAVSRAYRYPPKRPAPASLVKLREAAWDEVAVDIEYQDRKGSNSLRRIWPLAIVATETGFSCLAKCCLRQDFRHFRLDAITRTRRTKESFRPRRVALLREHLGSWRSATATPRRGAAALDQKCGLVQLALDAEHCCNAGVACRHAGWLGARERWRRFAETDVRAPSGTPCASYAADLCRPTPRHLQSRRRTLRPGRRSDPDHSGAARRRSPTIADRFAARRSGREL